MKLFTFGVVVVLCTFCEEAAPIAKETGGSQTGSRVHRRLASNGDSSHSDKTQGLDQVVRGKTKRQKTDTAKLDNNPRTRRSRAPRSSVGEFGASDEEVNDDHVELSRTFRRRRRDASSAVDRKDGRHEHEDVEEEEEEEEEEYWGDGREGEREGDDSGVSFDLVEEVLPDEADHDGNNGDCNDYGGYDDEDGEERSHRYGSGDDKSRRENRRSQRRDDHLGTAYEDVARPGQRRTDGRRRSSGGGIPPAGREKKNGSVMKSVGSATGKSVKAVVHALQPKSVGLGEILDTWKIEQMIGEPPGRVTRCAATVEFRRDGTVATSFEGRETVSEFTFRSHSWPRTCTIEFEARAFQGPWDEEPVWKLYKGFFSRKLLDPKVIMLQGAIYDVTGKMLWRRRVKVGEFTARRRPSRAFRGGDGGQGRAAVTGRTGGGDRRQSKRGRCDCSDRDAAAGGRDRARMSSRAAGDHCRRGSGHADEL